VAEAEVIQLCPVQAGRGRQICSRLEFLVDKAESAHKAVRRNMALGTR
jgi:hypothetical protein